MDEIREKFLREVVARVPLARLVELHLFPPMRQGVLETGVAVVAALPEPTAPPLDLPEGEAVVEATPQPGDHDRHVVYTARYRWTRKGPDRGRWEVEVVAEADAPLVTVEAVVRGVRERTAESGDPERLGGSEVGALLAEADAWATTAR